MSYRDIAPPETVEFEEPLPASTEETPAPALEVPSGPTQEQIAAMVDAARREAMAQTEARLQAQHQKELDAQRARIDEAIAQFAGERREYFGKVERDVLELALSIAAKILHRESQIDPLLLSTLVRVAIEKINSGSSVRVRVPMKDAAAWTARFRGPVKGHEVEVVGDESLAAGDCVLETGLGSANFGMEAQLKEVEQGFFDLLSRRPEAA